MACCTCVLCEMIDQEGYRPNVGIVLCNQQDQVLLAQRIGGTGWQFPQGGIQRHEDPAQAMYRELYEEVGLASHQVAVVGRTRDWLRYELPSHMLRSGRPGSFRGQKQVWYLLRFLGDDADVRLDCGDKPEFESWQWVQYWQPLERVIAFKRDVYRAALTELEPLLNEPIHESC